MSVNTISFLSDLDSPNLEDINLKDIRFSVCLRSQIESFVEEWHYSKNINGLICDYCFKADYKDELVGAMIYGKMAMAGTWKRYADTEEDLLELRRLCCIDKTPKNLESKFIGWSLRWLKSNTQIKKIISYSDLEYGHSGTIYKASNFKLYGQSPEGKVIWYKGRRYHDKTIRTKYKGRLKPFAKEIKDALETGTAVYKKTKPKNIWIYEL